MKKHGERVADSLIDSKKGGVALRKLVGAVLASDNAAGAVKSPRELMKIVAALVEEEMGGEWGKPQPRRRDTAPSTIRERGV